MIDLKIKIKDKTICQSCKHKTCSVNTVVEPPLHVARLKSEKYTCPVKLLKYVPTEEQLEQGYIDVEEDNTVCIHCYLCKAQCSQDNLYIEDESVDMSQDIDLIKTSPNTVNATTNIMATSYLNCIFGFSANALLNKALTFDGYAIESDTANAPHAFVEVDIADDSLESIRRLLGDILINNYQHSDNKIHVGIMVLTTFPKSGSRDVFNQLADIKKFPHTKDLMLYTTTFEFLRYAVLHLEHGKYTFNDLFIDFAKETIDGYKSRLISNKILSQEIAEAIIQ